MCNLHSDLTERGDVGRRPYGNFSSVVVYDSDQSRKHSLFSPSVTCQIPGSYHFACVQVVVSWMALAPMKEYPSGMFLAQVVASW